LLSGIKPQCIVSNQIGMRDTAYSGAVDQYGNVVERLTGVDTYKVISLDLKHKVLTNTYSNEMGEDIREYLHKLRNYKSYSCLAEEGYRSLEWEDIFCERNYDVSNNGK